MICRKEDGVYHIYNARCELTQTCTEDQIVYLYETLSRLNVDIELIRSIRQCLSIT